MRYKLAKQLKEAGFPQPEVTEVTRGGEYYKGVYIPLLEEVIEECGDDLEGIEKMETGGWGAYTYSKKWANSIGVTHLEAVSNLYIKLTRNNKA